MRAIRQARLVRLLEKSEGGETTCQAPFADAKEFEQKLQAVLWENHNAIERLQTRLKQANEELDRMRGSEVLILQMIQQLSRDHQNQKQEISQRISKRRSTTASVNMGAHIAA